MPPRYQIRPGAWAWALGVAATGAVLLALVAGQPWPRDSGLALVACAMVAMYGDFRATHLRGFGALSLGEPVYFAVALLFGPGPAALTAVPVNLAVSVMRGKPAVVVVFNGGWAAVVFTLTGLAWQAFGVDDPFTAAGLAAAAAAACTYGATAGLLQAVGQSYFLSLPLRDTLRDLVSGVRYAVASALGLGLVTVALLRLGAGWAFLLALPVEVFSGYVAQARLNRELSLALDRLRRAQAALVASEKRAAAGLLAAGVAHEINNPLAAVRMNSHMLRGAVPSDLAGHLDVIDKAVDRCQRITEQLLVFARPPRDPGPCDLAVALDETLLLMGKPLRDDLVTVTKPAAGFLVRMPQGPLMQVLANLLQNAHRAVRDRGGPGRIDVEARRDGDRVLVRVADTGRGIPEEARERIWDPFFTTREVGEGTGLGLALVRSMVEEAGGSVVLERTGPEGTVFRLELGAA